jgi:hypothetical protein
MLLISQATRILLITDIFLTSIVVPSRPARQGNAKKSAKVLRVSGSQHICHTDMQGGFQLVNKSAMTAEPSQAQK